MCKILTVTGNIGPGTRSHWLKLAIGVNIIVGMAISVMILLPVSVPRHHCKRWHCCCCQHHGIDIIVNIMALFLIKTSQCHCQRSHHGNITSICNDTVTGIMIPVSLLVSGSWHHYHRYYPHWGHGITAIIGVIASIVVPLLAMTLLKLVLASCYWCQQWSHGTGWNRKVGNW